MTVSSVAAVSRSVWQPNLQRAFRGLPFEVARVAQVILTTMHNRHVGITPELAADFAGWLLNPEPETRKGIWRFVFQRLDQEASGHSDQGTLRRVSSLNPGQVPVYSILRLAMPLVDAACRQIGSCYLYCEDEDPTSPASPQLTVYAENLHRALIGIARDSNPNPFMFDRALALSDYARRPGTFGRNAHSLPETDLGALALLRHLNPELPTGSAPLRHPKPMTSRQKLREATRQREGGIDGIRISRRIEDMGDMLLSEFINHPIILADRLLNNGYMIHRRRPRREKLRDILIVGILPAGRSPLMTGFIKACWFDLIARISWMLTRNKLIRSEFRWLEGDQTGGFRSQTLLLQDLPVFNLPSGEQPDPKWRHHLLKALGWLPSFLDQQAQFQPLPTADLDDPAAWISAAWRNQREDPRWVTFNAKSADPGPSRFGESFSHVHLMTLAAPNPNLNLESLIRRFRQGNLPADGVSLTCLPEAVNLSPEWRFSASGRPGFALFNTEEKNINYRQLAGRILGTWLDQLVKEIWRG